MTEFRIGTPWHTGDKFQQTENLQKIIQEEQSKHPAPFGCTKEFNMELLRQEIDPIKEAIDKACKQAEYEESLFIICEMAKRWVEDQRPLEIIYQGKVPLNPKTKKNSQKIIRNARTKGHMIVQSDAYRQYERDAGWFIHNSKLKPIDFPVNIKYTFFRENEIRCDGLNLSAAMDDILVKYGILADDNFKIVAGHDGTRVFIDRDNPRTEIEITRMQNYNISNGGKTDGQPDH